MFQTGAALSPERITHCLCPHLWEMSTSQGRELIAESLRLLALNRERQNDEEKKTRERKRLRSVTRMEKKSDGQGAYERE